MRERERERENLLLLIDGLILMIASNVSFICTTLVTTAVEYWLERKIAQWVHQVGSI